MREIKFRGKDSESNNLIYFDLDNIKILNEKNIVDIEMFTGLQDAYGNDVYTGDKVKASMENDFGSFETVEAEMIFYKGSFTLDLLTGGDLGFGGSYKILEIIKQ